MKKIKVKEDLMASYSTIAPEFEAMTQSAIANVRKLTDEQLERFGELMIRKGTPSAGIRGYGYSDILKGSSELEAAERSKYGLAGLEFGEGKRRFGETISETQRQFDIGTQLKKRKLSLFEQQLADLKEARRKEAKNWWKKYLGTALGTGLGLVTGNWLSGAIGIGKTAMTGATGQLFGGTPEQMNIVQQYPYLFGEESYAFNK